MPSFNIPAAIAKLTNPETDQTTRSWLLDRLMAPAFSIPTGALETPETLAIVLAARIRSVAREQSHMDVNKALAYVAGHLMRDALWH